MNKGGNYENTGDILSTILNSLDRFNPCKTIYLVKCKVDCYNHSRKSASKNTYNLFSFENLEEAKEYFNLAYEFIIDLNLNDNFKFLFDPIYTDKTEMEDNNGILYEKRAKLIANANHNSHMTKFFIFTLEAIKFK